MTGGRTQAKVKKKNGFRSDLASIGPGCLVSGVCLCVRNLGTELNRVVGNTGSVFLSPGNRNTGKYMIFVIRINAKYRPI